MRPFVGSMICAVLMAGSALAAGGRGRSEGGFRCDTGQLVSRGDDMLEVENACGLPDLTNQSFERRGVVLWSTGTNGPVREERFVDVTVDEWIYDGGPMRLRRVVQFENGRVIRINTD